MTARSVASDAQASSCYFRTTTDVHHRKALVQIDDRCNLHCAHCFVSATRHGGTMPYEQITGVLIPRLAECRVERVTLTGGEGMHQRDNIRRAADQRPGADRRRPLQRVPRRFPAGIARQVPR